MRGKRPETPHLLEEYLKATFASSREEAFMARAIYARVQWLTRASSRHARHPGNKSISRSTLPVKYHFATACLLDRAIVARFHLSVYFTFAVFDDQYYVYPSQTSQ
jgi:hypothetical protein